MYDADVVPVGEDQVSHVELSREIARRFNFINGGRLLQELSQADQEAAISLILPDLPRARAEAKLTGGSLNILLDHARSEQGLERYQQIARAHPEYFTSPDVVHEPDAMLTQTPRIPGTDGRKMSKSYNNFISLSESDDSIRKKTRAMVTDPARKRREDVGNPDVCPVYDWHKLFSTPEVIQRISRDCRTAAIGCVDCKQVVADALIKWIEPVRERRRAFEAQPADVLGILDEGSKKARAVATSTMERVREAVFGWKKTRESISSKAGS